MAYLIDTHVFIWYAMGDLRLSSNARKIMDSNAVKYLSIVSVWEMGIKVNIGKLNFSQPFEQIIEHQIELNAYQILGLGLEHIYKLTSLPFHHRDPFDRLIICQAKVEKLPIISSDNKFKDYIDLQLIS